MKFNPQEQTVMEILAEAVGANVQELAQRKRRKPHALQEATRHAKNVAQWLLIYQAQYTRCIVFGDLHKGARIFLQRAYADFSVSMCELAQFFGFRLLSIAPIFPTSNPA